MGKINHVYRSGGLRKFLPLLISISNSVFSLLLLPAVYGFMLLPYVFTMDAGMKKWYFLILVIIFPVILSASFYAWIPLKKEKYNVALAMALLPLVDVVILACIFFNIIGF
jgi:hypothetical protein